MKNPKSIINNNIKYIPFGNTGVSCHCVYSCGVSIETIGENPFNAYEDDIVVSENIREKLKASEGTIWLSEEQIENIIKQGFTVVIVEGTSILIKAIPDEEFKKIEEIKE